MKFWILIIAIIFTACTLEQNRIVIDDSLSYQGIDVSHHQGTIDWCEVSKDTAIHFVYIKATEGATYVDKQYRRNTTEARANGFKIGSYHFFRMTSSAHAQFALIKSVIRKEEQNLVPLIDVETTDGHSIKETRDSLRVLLSLIEEHYGTKPMIYGTNRSFNQICSDKFKEYNAYIGRYGKNAPQIKGDNDYHYYIWQYTENGTVKGISKPVDLWRLHPDADISTMLIK